HTLITIGLAILLSALFGIGYSITVTPNEKQAKLYDTSRRQDLSSIASGIDKYYGKKKELPKSLEALEEELSTSSNGSGNILLDSVVRSFYGMSIRDPQTNQMYELKYSDKTAKDYELCAVFGLSNKDSQNEKTSTSDTNPVDDLFPNIARPSSSLVRDIKHDKGRQCLKFSINDSVAKLESDYQKQATVSPSYKTAAQIRDVNRKSDLREVRSALEGYYNDNAKYPTALTVLTEGSTPYIKELPKDPSTNASYTYKAENGCYSLSAKLEDSKDIDSKDGVYSLTCAE
ncbi:hypothetical protein KBC99_02695, partial [Candidatus Saccharibacteria bacterium]|nr:hypothetical protein [Candidatus Saccharibacteria bacterium]